MWMSYTHAKWRRTAVLILSMALVSACGGGGGSNAQVAAQAAAAPAAGGAGAPSVPYSTAEQLRPFITEVSVSSDGQVLIQFQLTDQTGAAIIDLNANDLRLTIAKLRLIPIGNLTGNWQSYINQIETPSAGIGSLPRMQATNESGSAGELTNNADGTYRYLSAASITSIADQAIEDQADLEGLDLSYEPMRTHRVALEFRNALAPSNVSHDWVPETGISEIDGLYTFDVVATANCNGCHEQLAAHGGNRVEVRYCVTCHNAGSTDADSTNTVAFRNMVHKIHAGAALPSVQSGTPYIIYGRSASDYSNLNYPGDLAECPVCHGGNATATSTTLVATNAGDNWSEFATMEACGSCHDDVDFDLHFGGQPTNENCMSCHQTSGVAGSIASVHFNQVREAGTAYQANVLSVGNSGPGEIPVIRYSITDPTSADSAYDILNHPSWTQPTSSLSIKVGWSTTDYTNTGNGGNNAGTISVDALANSIALGDGLFEVSMMTSVPDGLLAPNIPATGSGAAVIEPRPAEDFGTPASPDIRSIPVPMGVGYFSIDEVDGVGVARRSVVEVEGCLGCHGQLAQHGGNRTNTIAGCVTCHNPRNTDKRVRDIAVNPPTDGKDEESIDFKTLIHGIHASRFRSQPLQIVGFGGFSTNLYDADAVRYPGKLGNCTTCHADDTFTVPLQNSVLAPTFDTGPDIADPLDDRVVSPTAATCASCHDGATTRAHMQANGADFDTTQLEIDTGVVLEQCEICHGSGRAEDVSAVHPIN